MTAKTWYLLLVRLLVFGVGFGVFAVLLSSGMNKWASVVLALIAAIIVAVSARFVRNRIPAIDDPEAQ